MADPAYREAERLRARARRERLRATDPGYLERERARHRGRRERQRAREASALVASALAVDELACRIGSPRRLVEAVVGDELRTGRAVRLRDGRVALVASEFPRGALGALRTLPADFVLSANGNGAGRRARLHV